MIDVPAFSARFERRPEPSDLDRAISGQKEALRLTPDGHPLKPRFLNGLANCLLARFEHLGERSDFEEAELYYKNAIQAKHSA